MSDELKPCPFCGRAPFTQMRYADGDSMKQPYLGVKCSEHTGWITVEQWNRRSAPAGERERVIEVGSIEDYETDEWACAAGVKRFAAAMREKLDRKRKAGRGGWNKPDECELESLRQLLAEHASKGDVVDIANICMMIWNREHPEGR